MATQWDAIKWNWFAGKEPLSHGNEDVFRRGLLMPGGHEHLTGKLLGRLRH
jgi:hypothetical protein